MQQPTLYYGDQIRDNYMDAPHTTHAKDPASRSERIQLIYDHVAGSAKNLYSYCISPQDQAEFSIRESSLVSLPD